MKENTIKNALSIIELLKNLEDFNIYLYEILEISSDEVEEAIELIETSLKDKI